MPKNRDWEREELFVAMNLYCRLPFGKLHKGNPSIIALASALERTPSSVAMKLCNFASLDPAQHARGISGLSKASRADRAVWMEFHTDWEAAAIESQKLYDQRMAASSPVSTSRQHKLAVNSDTARKIVVTEQMRSVKVRIGQDFFRRCVLASYAGRCGISGIMIEDLLVASHILPWCDFPEHRVDPCNGLCLSRLHDAAFDRGLVTFDNELRLVLSNRLKEHVTNNTLHSGFAIYEGKPLNLPDKFRPNLDFLAKHRESIFAD